VRPAHRYGGQAGFLALGHRRAAPEEKPESEESTAIYISEATPRQRTTRQWAEPENPEAAAAQLQIQIQMPMLARYGYIGVAKHNANGRGWRRAPRVAGFLGCYWENPGIGHPNRQWYVLRVLSSLGD